MQRRITLSLTWKIFTVIIIVIFLCLFGISYSGYHLYKKVLATEATQKIILENQNKEQTLQDQKSKALVLLQEQALQETKDELTKTKTDAEKTNAQIKTLTQVVQKQSKEPKDSIITSGDLAPYVTGVVQVICTTASGVSSGSGTLWTFKEVPYAVVTNHHVIEGATSCVVSITNTANVTTGIFSLSGSVYTYNKDTDEAILGIGSSISQASVPIPNYNFSVGKLRTCPTLMAVGTPVVIIGYPAYAKHDSTLAITGIGTVNVIYRTVTNGIISGYDTSQKGEANYFVSAKIDNGNSGGMSLAKDSNGLCILGLPTWLTVGNYETQGLVQNILNVLPTTK